MLHGRAGAALGTKLEVALHLIESLTLRPIQFGGAACEPLRRAGASQREIEEVILICCGFHIINRVADAFDFAVPAPGAFAAGAEFLRTYGYRMASGVWLRRAERRPDALDARQAAARKLLDAALSAPGRLDQAARAAIFHGAAPGWPLELYCAKVRHHAPDVTDADVAALRAAGYSEDQVFEATICAALGAGFARLKIGLSAAGAAWPGMDGLLLSV